MFVLVVLLLHGHVWGSIRVHHLWVRSCFSSSVSYFSFLFVRLLSSLFSLESLSHQSQLMVSHWSLRDSKSTQVSTTLLSILANDSNAVLWMVSTRPLISKSSSPCTIHLMTVPSAPITIIITVNSVFHSFFTPLARSWC